MRKLTNRVRALKSTSRLLCYGMYHVMNELGLLRKFRTASDERAQGLARGRTTPCPARTVVRANQIIEFSYTSR